MESSKRGLVYLITAMTIFGTVGIFSKYIPLPSSVIALARAVLGLAFLALLMLVKRAKPDMAAIKVNLLKLLCSGAFLGINWLLFFEACKKTTVSSATLSYYLAPVLIIIIAAVVFKEKIGIKKLACILLSLLGMVFVSGIFSDGGNVRLEGILYGLAAALLYALIVVLNKSMKSIGAIDKTAVQFAVSVAVLIPYILIAEDLTQISFEPKTVAFLAIIGIVHTGIAYALYFGSSTMLSATSLAIYSYIDPILALIVSAFLGEGMDALGVVGAVLIIGSSVVCELDLSFFRRKSNENR